MANEKKPFFLKRWSDTLFFWIDKALFNMTPENNQGDSLAVPAWLTFLIGIGDGLVIAILQMFLKKAEKVPGIVGSVVAVVALGLVVYFIVRNLNSMEGTWPKVARSAAMLILSSITFGLGVFIGVWVWILLVVGFIGWIVFTLLFGSSSSDKTIKLDDGTILKKRHGLTGEVYYEGSDGYEYEKNSDGTFSRR